MPDRPGGRRTKYRPLDGRARSFSFDARGREFESHDRQIFTHRTKSSTKVISTIALALDDRATVVMACLIPTSVHQQLLNSAVAMGARSVMNMRGTPSPIEPDDDKFTEQYARTKLMRGFKATTAQVDAWTGFMEDALSQ